MLYQHDCKGCVYLATTKYRGILRDFYICGNKTKARTILARYGSKDFQYSSNELFECVALTDLDWFVLSRGLELNEHEKERLLKTLLSMAKTNWSRYQYSIYLPETKEEEHLFGNENYLWE